MNRRMIALLSLGHGTVDVYSGALPMLLFVLRPTLHLSYAMVGAASVLFTLTSSVVQPVFGYLSDRRRIPGLLPIGCLLCACGISVAGFGAPYPLLLALIAVSGLGSALYHPEATKTTAYFSGERRGSGMSLFSVGGNVGFALGPGLLLLLLAHLRAAWPFALIAYGSLIAFVLWAASGRMRRGVAASTAAAAPIPAEPVAWGSVIRILAVVMLRSWVHMGLVYFLPYWAARTAGGIGTGTYVSAFLFSGALGTLVGGPLADRWGRKRVVLLSLAPLTPLLLLFLALRGAPALGVIALCGFLIIASFSVTVVMSQELMARNIGMASGLTTGFAIGMGGLGVLGVGALADHIGLGGALLFIALLPLPALGLATLIRESPARGRMGGNTARHKAPRPAAAR